jgi:23S rRNA (adenine2503-C2)-methyltransferase
MPGLPKRLREYLSEVSEPGLYGPLSSLRSADGSVKYIFATSSDLKFETVFIPDGKRKTVCVSTQSGCRMGCRFCATGKYGFHGNLEAGDIINQVSGIQASGTITHVVFMGMGEPLDNTDNVLKACEILTAPWGMAISPRNITLSTVGITPSIVRFLESSSCNLALSLFSPFPEERGEVIPAERKYPAHEIIKILADFPLKKKRRISAAYVMIAGVNDSNQHLEGLHNLLAGTGIRVNLLPYHPLPGDPDISSSSERMQHFRHTLTMSGIQASIRRSRGSDIAAACGLLASGLS